MNEAFFADLLQAVVKTYTALAADIPFVIAVAQAALQFVHYLVEHIKKQPPSSRKPQAVASTLF